MNVAACIVTRGDVPLDDILESLPPSWAVEVWDNSAESADLAVYGRYAAIIRAPTDVVYVQDDDCVLAREHLEYMELEYEPGYLTANMPQPFRAHYTDSCLIGFGAIFDKRLPEIAFERMPTTPPDFPRTCDVYFTALTPTQKWLDLPYRDQGWATADNRMYRQSQHVGERHNALLRARRYR